MRLRQTILAAVGSILVVGCTGASAQVQPAQQIANPASQNCVARGGMLRMESRPDGGQYGVCIFDDNYQCEEWAMFRGECPVGGLRVTGYITTAARYCAITGGRYAVVAQQRCCRRAGRMRVARRPGMQRRRLLCRHVWPVTAGRSVAPTAVETSVRERVVLC
jgi:putative hemolysin